MIETIVFDILASAIEDEFPTAIIKSDYSPVVESFPCVYIEMSNVDDDIDTLTTKVNYENLAFEMNIFTTGHRKKNTAKLIADIIQDEMTLMGFLKETRRKIDNPSDREIYRILMRYTGRRRISDDKIFRR